MYEQQILISEAINELKKVSFGPNWMTQLVYRKENIELRLMTDGISFKERDLLENELENVNQNLFAATLDHWATDPKT